MKFDVTSSDGGANGWNYEDGTFSPQTVVERIEALNNGTLNGRPANLTPLPATSLCENLSGEVQEECLAKANSEWLGAQATVQRWYADPQWDNKGQDRTLRTVFTHDHFGLSTHQQAGLYMGLLVQRKGSKWRNTETGELLNTRADGGPTSFQAMIETSDPKDNYRQFALEFQDCALAYEADSTPLSAYPEEK